jgi:hypothetical protein
MSKTEAKSDITCCGVLSEGTFRYVSGEVVYVVAGWPLDGEAFTDGEQGDGVEARVTKRGEVTAPGGPPDLHVGVSGLFLFTAIMWMVSRIAIMVRQYVPDW